MSTSLTAMSRKPTLRVAQFLISAPKTKAARGPLGVKLRKLSMRICFPFCPRTRTLPDAVALRICATERINSNLAAARANARGRSEGFPSLRPVLTDQCRSLQDCLPTKRVRLRESSSAQRFRAHSRRYGSCAYRHARQVSSRDAFALACSSF